GSGAPDRPSLQGGEPVDHLDPLRHDHHHRPDPDDADGNRTDAYSEHLVHPHHKAEESDQHRSEYHRMVTEKPFPGKGAEDVRHDPEGGQDHDVHFRVTKNRSEEHTSELQSRENLVCRLLLEKKTQKTT